MNRLHPALPKERPLVIAHRSGNELPAANDAYRAGADMIETDIWRFRNRLELRHVKTMGPIPLLWDRWELHPGWGHRFQLDHLLQGLPIEARLFLDLKGIDPRLPIQTIEYIRREQPERQIILCGRTWAQLDLVEEEEDVTVFFSVGSDEELAAIWSRLDRMEEPAISIHKRYLNEETVKRFKDRGTTIVTWAVDTFAEAKRLHELGVDGFTTDNQEMVKWIPIEREKALDREDPLIQEVKRPIWRFWK
jgi:glycerophosphoryl diester phosphodiesterase